jgi:Protein of unknown function (DUF3987)
MQRAYPLQAMMQKDGPMAAFRGILRRLDDHKEEYVYSTISRGRDVLIKPYVTLLANVTPADLQPFLRAQNPLWRDGYIARVAFVTPGDAPATTDPFPEGPMTIPDRLILPLTDWHGRLGTPLLALEPVVDTKGKATGKHLPVYLRDHQETTYVLHPEVRQAFYSYDSALRSLMAQSNQEDLDGSYARFPIKALRIAGLLASLHDESGKHTIYPAHWARGQQIAERWRRDLHAMIQQVQEDPLPSKDGQQEQRILNVLRANPPLSIRDIYLKTKLAYGDIEHTLAMLTRTGIATEFTTARTKKYAYAVREHH